MSSYDITDDEAITILINHDFYEGTGDLLQIVATLLIKVDGLDQRVAELEKKHDEHNNK